MIMLKLIVAGVITFGIFVGLAFWSDKSKLVSNIFEYLFSIKDENGRYKKGWAFKGKLLMFTVFVGLAISFNHISIPFTYSDGTKSGNISKFTKKGFFYKTWEGEMNLGGMVSNGDGGMVANIWYFSVTNPVLIEQIQTSMELGRTTLTYDQRLLVPITQGSTNYIITEVK